MTGHNNNKSARPAQRAPKQLCQLALEAAQGTQLFLFQGGYVVFGGVKWIPTIPINWDETFPPSLPRIAGALGNLDSERCYYVSWTGAAYIFSDRRNIL